MTSSLLGGRSRRRRLVAVAVVAVVLVTVTVVLVTGSHPNPSPVTQPSPSSQAGQADIFGLLPFNQGQLNAAYISAARAAAAYETFSYTDTPASYGARIGSWVTPTYLAFLQQTFGSVTTTAARTRTREQSTATSAVQSIRVFGPTSITFIVHISQHDPITDDTGDFAVTVATTDGRRWLTDNIVPAAAGNA